MEAFKKTYTFLFVGIVTFGTQYNIEQCYTIDADFLKLKLRGFSL